MKKYVKSDSQIEVEYNGGQSRYSTEAVDYMLADVNGIELYAELPATDEPDEDENYLDLKAEILDQAKKNGIPYTKLHFWYD